MWGVQAEGAAPFVKGEPIKNPETVATAIRIGNPASWDLAVAARDESGGWIRAVSDRQILDAQALIAAEVGVFVEPASAASVAGLLVAAEAGEVPAGVSASPAPSPATGSRTPRPRLPAATSNPPSSRSTSPRPPRPWGFDEGGAPMRFGADHVRVTVPASAGNMGPGFDCLGIALGVVDTIEVSLLASTDVIVEVTGEGEGKVPLDESHLFVRTLRAALDRVDAPRLPGSTSSPTTRFPTARGSGPPPRRPSPRSRPPAGPDRGVRQPELPRTS